MGSDLEGQINRWIGIPFQWGGASFDGADCAGLVRLYYREKLGVELPPDDLPHIPEAWIASGECYMIDYLDRYCFRVNAPCNGSIVVIHFRGAGAHLGIMYDHDRFLHIPYGRTSCIGRISSFGKHRVKGYWMVSK
jgi:cell wall-associated NlpC family hydrolase